MFKYAVTSEKKFDQTLADLERTLVENKFGVLWKLDVKKQLQSKGQDFKKDFYIFEVCNAAKAKEVLEKNIIVGYFLPCKIVVYEENGQTVIGMVKPSTIINLLGDTSLEAFAKEVEETLIKAINAAK